MLKFAISVALEVARWFAISLGVVALLNLQSCIDQQQATPKQRPSVWRAA